MKAAKTFTATTLAWLPSYASMKEVNRHIDADATDQAISCIQMTNHDMTEQGWTQIGTASVTITLQDDDAIVGNQVATLRKELQAARAEAHMREQSITDRINNLLAITCDPVAPQRPQPHIFDNESSN